MNFSGIILAGGKSSRMGSDKGLLELNNKTMIEHVIACFRDAGISNIFIISNNKEYEKFGLPVFSDIHTNMGPLGGIHAGLMNASTALNIVLSCDIPFVSVEALKVLMNESVLDRPLVLRYDNRTHNLIGVYPTLLRDELEKSLLNNERRVSDFLEKANAKVIDIELYLDEIPTRCFDNLNTPFDLQKLTNEN